MRIRRVTLLVGSSVALAVAFWIFAGAPSGGQIAGVSDRQFLGAGEIDRFLAGVGGELGSGCALLLARQGKVFYEKSSGGFDARKPVRIASATKWLSGAVIISLVDEGKIKLDDLASRYLSGLTGEASRITVRQLLSHTSGLPMAHPALGERDITLKQAVDAIVTTPLVFPPGRACAYGDVSIQVAGRIAEIASGIDKPSGQIWKSLFTSRLSIPLEMTGTSCEGLRPTDNPHLAGGATSTARDYARFLSMLVNKGTLDGRRVLSEAAVAEMLRDQTGGSPLRFNPFQSFPDLHPGWRQVRYGIGSWLETVDGATGRALEASAPGIFGFFPWIDLERNLVGIFWTDSSLDKALPVYLRLKALLRQQLGEKSR